jgi:tetratricopeptide (TPR) repeat protein
MSTVAIGSGRCGFSGRSDVTSPKYSNSADRIRAEIVKRPGDTKLYLDLALTLESSGDINGAMSALRSATSLPAPPPKLWCLLAQYARRLGKHEQARAAINEGLLRHPSSLELYAELAEQFAHEPEALLEVYGRAAAACGESSSLLHNMGCAHQALDHPAEAERYYRSALARNDLLIESWNNLGLMLCEQSRFNEALQVWAQGLKRGESLPPVSRGVPIRNDPRIQIRWHRAMIWLLLENFADGWSEYEWRFAGSGETPPAILARRWTGELLAGKRILVLGEQGIGDEIFFASFLSDLTARGAEVVVACAPRLVGLFARAWPNLELHAHDRYANVPLPATCARVELQVPIGSLPGLLWGETTDHITRSSYLRPDIQARERWVLRHRALGAGISVGLSWRGGTSATKAKRSIPIGMFAPLGAITGARFIDIQYGSRADERAEFEREGVSLVHFGETDPLRDLDDFAAQLSALDIVISVDNSTVHLAGALGVPTWVLQPNVPEWRWGTERQDCRWYGSVRQFRQPVRGQWPCVIEDVAAALRQLTAVEMASPTNQTSA